jgi:hypothetical protein
MFASDIDTHTWPWAKVNDVAEGDTLVPDNGFECLDKGSRCIVHKDEIGLYINCLSGKHYLDGQIVYPSRKSSYYVGLYLESL